MKLDDLSYELIDEQSRYYDFSRPDWGLAVPLTDEEYNNEEYFPIYNRIYPLGQYFDIPEDFREKLNNMTIIRLCDDYHLALTGCGMNLTWQICESYLNLGYYPPVEMTELPCMSARGTSEKDQHIVKACIHSLESIVLRFQSRKKALQERYQT